MNNKVVLLIVFLLVSVSLSGCLGRGGKGGQDEPVSSPVDVDGDDYNVLYIGHSFGRKFAELLEDYAHTSGETNHAQYIEFSGGESGSPGLLWDDAQHQANIKGTTDFLSSAAVVQHLISNEVILKYVLHK